MGHHRLTLELRQGHIHRWWPHCACGWDGPKRRRRKEAEEIYRAHVRYESGRRGPGYARPQRPTSPDTLPDELRRSSDMP